MHDQDFSIKDVTEVKLSALRPETGFRERRLAALQSYTTIWQHTMLITSLPGHQNPLQRLAKKTRPIVMITALAAYLSTTSDRAAIDM